MADSRRHAEGADLIPAQRFFNPSAERRISAVSEINVQGGEDDEDRNHTLGSEPHTAAQSRKKSSFATRSGALPLLSAIANPPLCCCQGGISEQLNRPSP